MHKEPYKNVLKKIGYANIIHILSVLNFIYKLSAFYASNVFHFDPFILVYCKYYSHYKM